MGRPGSLFSWLEKPLSELEKEVESFKSVGEILTGSIPERFLLAEKLAGDATEFSTWYSKSLAYLRAQLEKASSAKESAELIQRLMKAESEISRPYANKKLVLESALFYPY